MRWSTGEATIERLLAAGHIERIQGPRRTETPGSNGRAVAWKRRASSRNRHRIAASFCPMTLPGRRAWPCSPSRACAPPLAVTTRSKKPSAQFGPVLRAFGGLRRRRNELEYPLYPTEQANAEEASETLKTAAAITEAVAKLLPNLGFF